MIPLKDTIPSRTFPFVNYAIIALNVIVFIFELLLGKKGLEMFFLKFGLVPANFFAAWHSHNAGIVGILLPFFTCMFLHAGWLHIIGNMWFLYIFGDNIEDKLGHIKYIFFYLACGFVAGASQFVFALHSHVPMIGASGAIAGVLGAYLLLFPQSKILTLVPIVFFIQIVELPAFIFLLIWFLIQFFYGTISIGALSGVGGGVAWWAHIGGFIMGMVLVKVFLKRRKRTIVSYPTKWEIN